MFSHAFRHRVPRLRGLRRLIGLVGLAALLSTVTLAATQGSALAASTGILESNSSWLNVGVRGGSTAINTDIIQWYSTRGSDQQWNVYTPAGAPANAQYFQNVNSGYCITTDGTAGDPLFQAPCSADNRYQQWQESYVWWAFGATIQNPASGLVWDVQGNSYGAGAEIDGWYPNNQLNQVFSGTA
jgi:Ricin-type beta-trefoil lectin domain